jgi:hypothetical protein
MVTAIVCAVGGFVGGVVAAYFFARNNKALAIKAINEDIDKLAQEILDSTEVDDQLIDFIRKLKVKLGQK